MTKTLEAHDKLIREIFEGSYQFEIPDYQRPYAWTTEQATELFDDMYSAMQEVRSENEWTPTLLAERQRRLVGVLKDHWNLVVSTGTAAS